MGADFISNSANTDENGHSSHVSSAIGGATYGVPKKVKLVRVKVLNAQGSGSYSDIVAGMDWVARHAAGTKAVVNMSLGKMSLLNSSYPYNPNINHPPWHFADDIMWPSILKTRGTVSPRLSTQ